MPCLTNWDVDSHPKIYFLHSRAASESFALLAVTGLSELVESSHVVDQPFALCTSYALLVVTTGGSERRRLRLKGGQCDGRYKPNP
jgi:hypothetical protein